MKHSDLLKKANNKFKIILNVMAENHQMMEEGKKTMKFALTV